MSAPTNINNDDNMPQWVSSFEIDPKWFQTKVGVNCKKVIAHDISNATRQKEQVKDCATLRLEIIVIKDNNEISTRAQRDNNYEEQSKNDNNDHKKYWMVMKQVPPCGQPLSQKLGLAREAKFYAELSATLNEKFTKNNNNDTNSFLPHIYYSWGDMNTGAKVVIMEDLTDKFIDSGIFFGPGNPNNWSRDLPAMIAKATTSTLNNTQSPSSYQVAHITFQAIAKVHATFWKKQELCHNHTWLRGSAWLHGQDKESWEASQQLIQNFWTKCQEKERQHGESCIIQWDPLVKQIVIHAVQGISWEAHQKRLSLSNDSNWTLVHGDFWPGNVCLQIPTSSELFCNNETINKQSNQDSTTSNNTPAIRLIDWEMTGLGSGPQDLGQYVLSNFDPNERRPCERQLVSAYYQELLRWGVTNFTWDECWHEYKIGGLERWLWFLVYFVGNNNDGLEGWAQFFHDQISSFVHDHDIQPKDIVQPRP